MCTPRLHVACTHAQIRDSYDTVMDEDALAASWHMQMIRCALMLLGSFDQAIQRRAPSALYTIEHLVNNTFCKVPAVASLQQALGWWWLMGLYCSMTCELDAGAWLRKDTNFLVHGVAAGFHLLQCAEDCGHLLDCVKPGQWRQHKVVLCRNRSNWLEQVVLEDLMVKGMILHGAFQLLEEGWKSYCLGCV